MHAGPNIARQRLKPGLCLYAGNRAVKAISGLKGIETQGSIPGAINIPFDSIDKSIEEDNDIFNCDGPFLFCCTGGVMSYMAAIKAQEKGVKNVCNLEGGHSAWMKLQMT